MKTKTCFKLFGCLLIILLLAACAPAAAEEEPAPRWFDHGHHLVAHSMGALDGYLGSNSLEAFLQNYALGHRIFEVDFQISADGELVTIHESRMPVPRTLDELNADVHYTILTFREVLALLQEHEDAFIITDTKYFYDFDLIRETFDLMRDAIQEVDPALADRIIIQFYNQAMYHFMKTYYDFPNYVYTLYLSGDTNEEVIAFAEAHGIEVVVMWTHRAEAEFVEALREVGAIVFAHTTNDLEYARAVLDRGVFGIFTNLLIYEDLPR
ncbi:MAG: hypothetical protein FWE08_06300 [Oscillospiraceae bacterium]|nr:hypothetical protein [Oscillospiraceae bacterium]